MFLAISCALIKIGILILSGQLQIEKPPVIVYTILKIEVVFPEPAALIW